MELYVDGVKLTATGQVVRGLRLLAAGLDGSAQFEVLADKPEGTVEFRITCPTFAEVVRIAVGSSARS